MKHLPWQEIVENIRTAHNEVFSVELYFGHDGHNVCRFRDYEKQLAEGESGQSMQEAVERCVEAWKLEMQACNFARNPQGI